MKGLNVEAVFEKALGKKTIRHLEKTIRWLDRILEAIDYRRGVGVKETVEHSQFPLLSFICS